MRKGTQLSSEKQEKPIHRNHVPQTVFPAVCWVKKGVADRGSLSEARGEKRGKRGEKPSRDRVQPSKQGERVLLVVNSKFSRVILGVVFDLGEYVRKTRSGARFAKTTKSAMNRIE